MKTRPRRRLPFDPECRLPAFILGAIAILAFIFAVGWLWVTALILLILLLGFFRDPARRVPRIHGAVVSPADGLVDSIWTNEDPEAGPVGGPVIGIFLSVLDVHINRAPYAGEVEAIHYHPGKFGNAMAAASSKDNESNWIFMRDGRYRFTVRQVAGLIARRIVCRVKPEQQVRRGERIGMIRFGSRTELYLPAEARLQVEKGQKVKGGLTVLAYMPDEE